MLVKHIQQLQRVANAQKGTSRDDHIVRLQIAPPTDAIEKSAGEDPDNMWNAAAAILAAVSGGTLGIAAVKKLQESFRKKELQQMIDRNQNMILRTKQDERLIRVGEDPLHGVIKDATSWLDEYSVPSKGFGAAATVTLLTALASAVLANKVLKQQFPAAKPAKKPLMVRIEGTQPNAMEGALRMSMEKEASDTRALVDAYASGQRAGLLSTLEQAGVDAMLDLAKSASAEPSEFKRTLACHLISRDPLFHDIAATLTASELADANPVMFKVASHIPAEMHESLEGILAGAAMLHREELLEPIIKAAGFSYETDLKEGLDKEAKGKATGGAAAAAEVLASKARSPLIPVAMTAGITASMLGDGEDPEPEDEEEDTGAIDVALLDPEARKFFETHKSEIMSILKETAA